MNASSLTKILNASVLACTLLALSSTARAEQEKIIHRQGTYQNSKGGSGTTCSTTTRANGTVTRQGTWTNAAGGTGMYQSQAVWNRSTQTANVNGSVTRPNGATSTWQGTAQRVAPGQITGQGTITQANGKQDTYSYTDTKVAPGTWDKNEVITTPSGKTIDRSVDTSVANGQGTRTVTTTLPDGQQVNREASFSQSVTVQNVPAPQP